MSIPTKRSTYGNPLCWHCFNRLMYRRGGGGYTFALVIDRAGVEHRVHKDCVSEVTKDGHSKLKGK